MAPTLSDQAQFRDYSCCGLHHNDVHALVEHFEQAHTVVLGPTPGPYPDPLQPPNLQK